MTTYEQIEKKGFEKGIEKGILSEKMRLIIQGYKKGLSMELLAEILDVDIVKVRKIIQQHQNQ